MDSFPIIDPHHHLWDLKNNRYPWLQDGVKPIVFGDYAAICKDYLLDDFLDDCRNQNVVKSVHLDVGWDPSDPAGETRWLQELADRRGYPHGIVGYADLSDPHVEVLLEQHMQFRNFRGIRQSLNYHPDPVKTYLDRPGVSRESSWRRGFSLLQKYNLSFDLQIYYSQMAECLELAKAFPKTQIILDHCGMPVDHSPEDEAGWRSGMSELAQAENVVCKISGLGMGNFQWDVDYIRPYVLHAIDAFGVDRCMFASNFPVDKLFSDYDAIFDAFKEVTGHFSDDERTKLFHDNAERVYRL